MSKKVLKLAGRRPMLLALFIMATLTLGLLFSGWFTPTLGKAQPSNPNPQPDVETTNCMASSISNICLTAGSISLVSPTNSPVVCMGSEVSLSTSSLIVTGQLTQTITYTNAGNSGADACPNTTTNIPAPTPVVVTNWWEASVGNYSTNGSGSTAQFNPTDCGAGSVTFHLKYKNSLPCDTNVQSAGDVTGSFSVLNSPILTALLFSQNTDFTDDSGNGIGAGVQYWMPTSKTSALFTQNGGKAVVRAHLKICAPLASPATMTITGQADNGFTFTKTFDFPTGTTTYTVEDIESDQTFGDNFDYIGSISWTITYAQCTSQTLTDNNIYYVPNNVQPSKHIDTIMYVVCRAMKGKPYHDSASVNTIWGVFSGLNIICADRTSVLYYWKYNDIDNSDDKRITTMALLDPKYRSGNCNAWANLLCDAGQLAGSLADFSIIKSLKSTDSGYIDVKNQEWLTSGDSYGHDPYRYKSRKDWVWHYSGYSINCQGGQQPKLQEFANHVIVYGLNGVYYDPSYGNKANTILELENAEVDATWLIFPQGHLARRKSENLTTPFLQ